MKKCKFLAVLLVLAMTLSLLPTAALAAGSATQSGSSVASLSNDQDGANYYYYDSLAEAVTNAKSGDTVKLLDDVDYTSTGTCFDISKDLTLDLNGHSITALANGSCPDKGATHFIRVKNGGKLRIDDTSEDQNGSITAGYKANSQMFVIEVMNGAKLVVRAGTIQNAGGSGTNYGSSTVYVRGGGIFNLKGGTIHGAAVTAKKRTYPVYNNGDTTISGGYITSDASGSNGISHSGGTLTINGGTIDTISAAVSVSSSASAPVINGGKFSKLLNPAWISEGLVGVYDGTDTTVVSDVPADYAACINKNIYYKNASTGADEAIKNVVNGDTLVLRQTPTASTKTFAFGAKLTVTLENGATFDNANITPTAGCKVASAPSGDATVYTVVAIEEDAQAKIGDTYYNTLANAFAFAQDGDEVTVLKDINYGSSYYTISNKSLKLDLNGKTISTKKNKSTFLPKAAVIKFDGAGEELVIVDRSTEGTGAITNTGTNSYALYAANGTIRVKAGTYTGTLGALVTDDGTGSIRVVGGTFSSDPTPFVNSPFDVTDNSNGTFTVAVAADHVHGDLVHHPAVPATCAKEGKREYWGCACGKRFADDAGTVDITSNVTVPAHYDTVAIDDAVPATCTETGLTAGSHCSVCGTTLVAQTVVPAAGHSSVTDDAVPATCTTTGLTAGSHCSVCDAVLVAQTVIPATGHSSVTDDAVPATCTETGLTAGSHCSVCGATLVAQTTVPAAGHSFGDWITTKEPTTTEAGSAKRVCSVCSYEETKTIPVLGTYAITANVTNGTVTAAPNPAAKGETVTLTLTPDKGYSDTDVQLYYSYGDVVNAELSGLTFTMPDADVTVTGTFKPIAYQITYNLDGGTNSNANPSTYTVEKGFSLTAPTKSGYTFLGWSFNNNSDIIKEVTVKDGSTGDITFTAHWSYRGGGGGGSTGGSSSSTTTEKNPDGSTITTTTDKTTGTVTEVTKETDGSTTTVETKKDGTVTETVETANGTTGTVVTDEKGSISEVSASVSAAAAEDAAKTGAAVTLPVEVPVTKTTDSAPAVEVSVPKSSGSVKVEIPVENVTAGTVAVIVHADGTEEIVKTSVTTENGVALTLDGSATVKIIDNSKEFDDVQSVNHWAQDSIDFVTSRELFNGTSTTTFSPNEPTTRAQLMTVLARLDGADTTGAALDKGMNWAVENGISDGSNPNGTISRQQLAVMLYRYAGSPATQQTLNYPDADKVDGYAEAAMKWAVENGIVGGMDDGTLNPQGPATRAQVAAMMARFCTKMA